MTKLEFLLKKLEPKICLQNIVQTTVSASSIGWHIEHTLLTINKIAEATKASDARDYKWTFKPIKYIVFFTGKIPRGRAKNPKVVDPDFFNEDSLKIHIQKTKTTILELIHLEKEKYFKHPFFGNLKLKNTIKFLEIHTSHHLKIIEEIQKAALK